VRTILVGLGAVGVRAARQLLSAGDQERLVVLSRSPSLAESRAANLGRPASISIEHFPPARTGGSESRRRMKLRALFDGAEVVVLACPGPMRAVAESALDCGAHVVSTCDDPEVAVELMELNQRAADAGLALVLGAAMAPGVSCLLAAWAASRLDNVHEVHVATFGTGGPACAHRRHAALREPVDEWRDGRWSRKVASSGRELVWFPVHGGADCYRVDRPDGRLLVPALPGVRWVTGRAAASRRDRMTSWLPMLRPPHREGTVGAVRVEVRGERAGLPQSVVLGASGRPAVLAGTLAATAAQRAVTGALSHGAGGLAAVCPGPGDMLAELVERGLRLFSFDGTEPAPSW
jgi:saccharopine dehydrogenase-like NADP-dependent oxidoreductase